MRRVLTVAARRGVVIGAAACLTVRMEKAQLKQAPVPMNAVVQLEAAYSLPQNARGTNEGYMHKDRTPTVVLIHGIDSAKETWRGVLAALAKERIPAIAIDQRGHGESPLGHEEDFCPRALWCPADCEQTLWCPLLTPDAA